MKHTLLLFLLFIFSFFSSGYIHHTEPHTTNDLQMDVTQQNTSLTIAVSGGAPPYLIQVFSTSMEMKEFKGEKSISLKDLSSGTYIILCQDQSNEFIQKTIEF